MTEDAHRLADTIIKAATALIALAVAIYGVLQYVENSRNNSATQTVEREKLSIEKAKLTFELNRQRTEVLNRAAQAAADATWTAERAERLKAINRYTRIFVGELSLVANGDVISKGDELNERLEDMRTAIVALDKKLRRPADKVTRAYDEHEVYSFERAAVTALNDFVDACRNQVVEDFLGKSRAQKASTQTLTSPPASGSAK